MFYQKGKFMTLYSEKTNGKKVIYLPTKIEQKIILPFRDSYIEDRHIKEFIIDFSYVKSIESSILGILLNMRKSLPGASIILINCCKKCITLFELSGINKLFNINTRST